MIVPKGNDRSWNKNMWKYLQRYYRCSQRAIKESGSFEDMMYDMLVYGTAHSKPGQLEKDAQRTAELMMGLKPKKTDVEVET